MTYQSVKCKESRRKGYFDLDDVKGLSVLDLFESWARNLPADHFKDLTKQTYGTKPIVDRRNRLVILTMRTGHYGTAGDQVIDTSNHVTSYNTSVDDAQTIETRCALLVPPGAHDALFFVERQGVEGCGVRVMESFAAELRVQAENKTGSDGRPLELVVARETVIETEAWLQSARLEQVTVTQNHPTLHTATTDIGDQNASKPFNVTLSSTLNPAKGSKYLPEWIRSLVMKNKLAAASDIGFPEDSYEEMTITIGDGERRKSMVVDKEKTPPIRVLLNDHAQPALTTDKFVERIDAEAEGYYARRSLSYDYRWTRI